LSVILTADTRIAKRTGKKDLEPILAQNLRPGQKVTVMYSRNEFRNKAIAITVTEE